MLQYKGAILDGYLRVNVVIDSNKEFYNNMGEIGGGIRLKPSLNYDFDFNLEYLRGYYFNIETRTHNPYDPQYNDLRFGVNFGINW